ncbi:MAG: hypothetical protein Q4Q14_04195 [Methanobrevibacter sp.]|nr:hypothetical protein [Methanobrevibacter sp.]
MKLKFQKTERIYYPNTDYKFNSDELTEFLTDNFTIPDDNLNEISCFIDKDKELKRILFELPELIKKEFPNDEIQIRFYEEFKQAELILEIGIFTSFDEKSSFEKEKKLENQLYDKYNWDSADKILIIMEYQNE